MRANIKASKTDLFRHGIPLFIGRTNNDLCPVIAMMSYLAIWGNSPGPLFLFANGQFLTRQRLVEHLRSALALAGIDCFAYCRHSFRIGTTTTAAARGIQDATIKMLGRWQSSAYQRYIRTPREDLAAISSFSVVMVHTFVLMLSCYDPYSCSLSIILHFCYGLYTYLDSLSAVCISF